MTRVRVVLVALSTTLLLSGCFFMPSVPNLGGGTGGDGQSGQGEGSTQTETSTGDEMFQGVPATFPSDVPLVQGEVPMGVDVGTGWSVIVKVSDLEASFAEATDKLTAAGFESLLESASPEGSFGAFENAKYQVQVTSSDTEDYGLILSYLVVKKD